MHRPRPRVLAPFSTEVSWSPPENIVSGSATPTMPNIMPPSVDFTMAGTFSRPNSRDASIMNPAARIVTRAPNRPRGMPASSCQSSKVYRGTW